MKINSVIEQLYFAQKDHYNIILSPAEYREKLENIIKYEFELRAKLSPEILDLYDKIYEMNEELNSISMRHFYKVGFKAGFKIAVESFSQ